MNKIFGSFGLLFVMACVQVMRYGPGHVPLIEFFMMVIGSSMIGFVLGTIADKK